LTLCLAPRIRVPNTNTFPQFQSRLQNIPATFRYVRRATLASPSPTGRRNGDHRDRDPGGRFFFEGRTRLFFHFVIPAKADCESRPKNTPAFSAFPPSKAVRRRSEHSRSQWPEGRAAGAASQSIFPGNWSSKIKWIGA
jgi:hypothetical protein